MSISANQRTREFDKFRGKSKDTTSVAVSFDANASQETITLVDISDSSYIYIGTALPATLSSAEGWRIKRVDCTTGQIKILFANESQDYTNIWDDRASLTYG